MSRARTPISEMPVVILCGGQGTRLRPLTSFRPKPVVPLLNIPFLAYQLALLTAFALVGGLIELPFDIYGTFRIEQRFGFNRTTPRLFVIDILKGVAVGAAIGLPLAYVDGDRQGLLFLGPGGAPAIGGFQVRDQPTRLPRPAHPRHVDWMAEGASRVRR